MQLTKEQIEHLYKFTRQHYVAWYDLQSELVDHLANDIEQIWKTKPNLSFEQAKIKSFKKFGVFGFMDVVEKRQKALGKKYSKLIWKEFKQFFTIPKIIFTVSLFFAILFFIRLVNYNSFVIFTMLVGLIGFPIIALFITRKKQKEKFKETKKKYMFEEYITNLGKFASVFQIPFQILIHYADNENWTLNMELFFSFTFVICGLLFYISVSILPPKIRAIIAKEHPEYQIS